jgi:cell division protein FtsB
MLLRLPSLNPAGWSRGRRLVFLVVFGVTISFGARTLLGEQGLVGWLRMEAEAARLEARVKAMRADLDAERAQVRDLRYGTQSIERIAREKLGMAMPGEVIYLLPLPPEGSEKAPPAP